MKPIVFKVLWLFVVLATSKLAATEGVPTQLEMNTERVVIFKDGYCLVVKQAHGTTDANGNIYTDDVPDAAVLGSFWAIPQSGKLTSMVSGWVELEEKNKVDTEAAETIQLIEANLGADCSLVTGETKLSGKILKVLGPTAPRPAPDPAELFASVSLPGRLTTLSPTITTPAFSQFLLRTNSGDVMIDANTVRLLTIKDMKTIVEREATRKQRKKQMRFEFANPNSEVELSIMYFRPGVRWIPTYRIDLSVKSAASDVAPTDDKGRTVRLSLQGEIINEAEDFTDVPVDIVVGVPNFRFRNVASPLVLESVLRNALAQAAPQMSQNAINNGQVMFNNYLSNSGMQLRAEPTTPLGATTPQLPDDLTTQSGNDLFVYSLSEMTLKKGDRASMAIVTADVPYRDVHTWETAVQHTESISDSQSESPLVITENTIWRQLELVNQTKIPWTTGAAMIVDGFQPLAQELLTYTPSGSTVRIPVTIAVDVRGRVLDQELNRELNSLQFSRLNYAKVSGRIDAAIKNYKDHPVDLELRLRFGGKGTQASDEGEISATHFRRADWMNYNGDPAVNNSSTVSWSTTIQPGESFEPNAHYHFYTRH